jgi:hypothetical protein
MQSSATSQSANTRWTKKDSNARCATSSRSSKRCDGSAPFPFLSHPFLALTRGGTYLYKSKEKQAESIVEKLCQRFRLSEDTRQWRDVAFCLSLLPFKSERSVKKLVEGLPFYRDKLHEEGVYARFQEILAKARPPFPFLSLFKIKKKRQQARSNKAANKPDSELNEFETVRTPTPLRLSQPCKHIFTRARTYMCFFFFLN